MIEFGVWDRPASAFADLVEAVIHDILHDNDWHWPEWLSSEEWMRRTLAAGEVEVNGDELAELSRLYREQRVGRAAAIAGWETALKAARSHGPVGVITNFSDGHMQRDKIASAGLAGQFDGLFISGEVGIAKPEPGIFEHACREFGVPMADCVHIGNSMRLRHRRRTRRRHDRRPGRRRRSRTPSRSQRRRGLVRGSVRGRGVVGWLKVGRVQPAD